MSRPHLDQAHDPAWAYEAWKERQGNRAYYGPNSRNAWAHAIRWIKNEQLGWLNLPEDEAFAELVKDTASIFHPLFADDPHIDATCPHCGLVRLNASGLCPTCGCDIYT